MISKTKTLNGVFLIHRSITKSASRMRHVQACIPEVMLRQMTGIVSAMARNSAAEPTNGRERIRNRSATRTMQTQSAGGKNKNISIHNILPDYTLVDASRPPLDFSESSGSYKYPPAVVYRDVISAEEAELIRREILDQRMKRRRYEKGHWDSVIINYKEIELQDIELEIQALQRLQAEGRTTDVPSPTTNQRIAKIFLRIRSLLEENHLHDIYQTSTNTYKNPKQTIRWLPCHAIDLKKEGELNAHVDSVRFSGHLVAGLSLLSPAIMRLKLPNINNDDDGDDHASAANEDSEGHVDLFLPPNSLYALTGVGRYKYSHELLPDSSTFRRCEPTTNGDKDDSNAIVVPRDRRLSIIFRDAKPE